MSLWQYVSDPVDHADPRLYLLRDHSIKLPKAHLSLIQCHDERLEMQHSLKDNYRDAIEPVQQIAMGDAVDFDKKTIGRAALSGSVGLVTSRQLLQQLASSLHTLPHETQKAVAEQ